MRHSLDGASRPRAVPSPLIATIDAAPTSSHGTPVGVISMPPVVRAETLPDVPAYSPRAINQRTVSAIARRARASLTDFPSPPRRAPDARAVARGRVHVGARDGHHLVGRSLLDRDAAGVARAVDRPVDRRGG